AVGPARPQEARHPQRHPPAEQPPDGGANGDTGDLEKDFHENISSRPAEPVYHDRCQGKRCLRSPPLPFRQGVGLERGSDPGPARSPRLSRGELGLLLVLALVQFTHIMDFLIVMPLQPQLAESLHLTPRQFSHVVSAYGVAASVAGLVLAFLLD